MNRTKSRDISIAEYLECLIKEYFQAEMRAQIYTKRSDKNYWRRTAGHKRDKIEDITSRNRIPNIFNDTDTQTRYYDKFYPVNEIPPIIETSKDLKMYYSEGSDVTVQLENKVVVGRIEKSYNTGESADIRLFDDNTTHTFSYEFIRRIL